jgi:hypothetical protein
VSHECQSKMSVKCHLNVQCHKMSVTQSDIFQTFHEQKLTFDKTLIAIILPTDFTIVLSFCTVINIYKRKRLIKFSCWFYEYFQFYLIPNNEVDIYFQKILWSLIGNISSVTISCNRKLIDWEFTYISIVPESGILVGWILDELVCDKLCKIVNLECLKNVICDILNVTKKWHLSNIKFDVSFL